eukprot:Rhum_TRINITY_DN14781_c0_g1::Rhum_TRINITY_DN14781_c0_g1_i2::g.110595::m.110595
MGTSASPRLLQSLLLCSSVLVSSAEFYKVNTPYPVFPELDHCESGSITFLGNCSCDTQLRGSTLYIAEGHVPGSSKLDCTGCSGMQLAWSFDSVTGVGKISGQASLRSYTLAIASVSFTTSRAGPDYTVEYNFGHGVWARATGHFYDFFTSSTKKSWTDAQAACAAQDNDMLGLVGYLVTVTSAEESTFATKALDAEGWIGAADLKEDTWRWITGPEGMLGGCKPYDLTSTGPERSSCAVYPLVTSQTPCSGTECDKGMLIGTGSGNSFRNQSFENWQNGEPNDYGSGEDFAHFRSVGNWNDYALTHLIGGYVCEWGGIGELCIAGNSLHETSSFVFPGCGHYTCVSYPDKPMKSTILCPGNPPVCDEATCCAVTYCDSFSCSAGFSLKATADTLACNAATCTDALCCDADKLACDSFTCGAGFRAKSQPALVACAGTPPTCDTATCCDALAKCSEFSCGSDFNKALTVEIYCNAACTSSLCCSPKCQSFTCSTGSSLKPGGGDTVCSTGTCTDALCCETDKPTCDSFTCGAGFRAKSQPALVACAGTCDTATCCDALAKCSEFSC